MRLVPAMGALLCASALLLSGCSSPAADETSSGVQQVGESSVELDGDAAPDTDDAATDDAATDDAATDGAANGDEVADPEPDADATDADLSTVMSDFNDLFGEGGCMEIANVLMGWGFALLGPLTEGTTISREDADALFAATGAMPAEVEPHIAVLRKAIDAAVDQPQSKVVEIVGTPEVTDAMNGLTAYSDSVCGGDESAG